MGFGVPHQPLVSKGAEGRARVSSARSGLSEPRNIPAAGNQELVAEHVNGKREHAHRLWALLMLELWLRQYMDQSLATRSTPAMASG